MTSQTNQSEKVKKRYEIYDIKFCLKEYQIKKEQNS